MHSRELYFQTALPIFQNRMYSTEALAIGCQKGDIRLVENGDTGLVSNVEFDPSLLDYDADYQNEQGHSSVFQEHLEVVADLVQANMGSSNLVEVGCGKGVFLEMLLAKNIDVSGFDPTYEGNNSRVAREYFSEDLGVHGEGLILRHVLEHIPDPIGFLGRLKAANGGKGLIYIEVPCFDWICNNSAWYDIFYEHVNYFRLSDFERMFGRTLHLGRSFGGQYLSLVADLSTLRIPKYDPNDSVSFPASLLENLNSDAGVDGGASVVWGGASKGVIYALMRQRFGQPISHIIDINPAKQGRYLASTGLKVLSPSEGLSNLPEGTNIFVMNPNYLAEIRKMAGPNYNITGV